MKNKKVGLFFLSCFSVLLFPFSSNSADESSLRSLHVEARLKENIVRTKAKYISRKMKGVYGNTYYIYQNLRDKRLNYRADMNSRINFFQFNIKDSKYNNIETERYILDTEINIRGSFSKDKNKDLNIQSVDIPTEVDGKRIKKAIGVIEGGKIDIRR